MQHKSRDPSVLNHTPDKNNIKNVVLYIAEGIIVARYMDALNYKKDHEGFCNSRGIMVYSICSVSIQQKSCEL